MLNKMMKRTIALALAAVTFGLPLLSNDALASSHDDKKPAHKVERRMDQKAPQHKVNKNDHYRNNDKHKVQEHNIHHGNNHPQKEKVIVIHDHHKAPQPVHRPAHHHTHKHDNHSSNEKLATGLVIGAILGAVIANAN